MSHATRHAPRALRRGLGIATAALLALGAGAGTAAADSISISLSPSHVRANDNFTITATSSVSAAAGASIDLFGLASPLGSPAASSCPAQEPDTSNGNVLTYASLGAMPPGGVSTDTERPYQPGTILVCAYMNEQAYGPDGTPTTDTWTSSALLTVAREARNAHWTAPQCRKAYLIWHSAHPRASRRRAAAYARRLKRLHGCNGHH